MLIYDAGGAEGGWENRFEGKVVGYSSVMIAALSYALARHVSAKDAAKTEKEKEKKLDIAAAIEAGLIAARDLQEKGHGLTGDAPPTGFPVERLANTDPQTLRLHSHSSELLLPKYGAMSSAPSGTWRSSRCRTSARL